MKATVLKLNKRIEKELYLTGNERKALKILLQNSRVTDVEIGEKLNISAQAAFKIRKRIESKKLIKKYVTEINYKALGVETLALAMIEIKSFESKEFRKYLSKNLLQTSKLFISNGSYIALFGFKGLQELYNFFNYLQNNYPNIIKINNIYTLHVDGHFKNSSKEIFNKHIIDWGKEIRAKPTKIKEHIFKQKQNEKQKITKNEKQVLLGLEKNSRVSYTFLAEKMNKDLSDRGIAKIKERLEKKKIIKGYTLELDYSLLGINIFAYVFIEKKQKEKGINEGLCKWAEESPNILDCYRLNEGNLHTFFCCFRDLKEMENYWKEFQEINKDSIEIKQIFITTGEKIMKPGKELYENFLW